MSYERFIDPFEIIIKSGEKIEKKFDDIKCNYCNTNMRMIDISIDIAKTNSFNAGLGFGTMYVCDNCNRKFFVKLPVPDSNGY